MGEAGIPRRRVSPGFAWLGLLVFGAIDWFVVTRAVYGGPLAFEPGIPFWAGPLYLAAVLALGALCYFVLHWRSFAIGLVGGFALMTIVSAGSCTLFNRSDNGAVAGFFLYPLTLLVSGIAAAIVEIVRASRRR